MAEKPATEGEASSEAVKSQSASDNADAKPLQMSFADWKKNKEPKEQPTNNARKTHKNENWQQGSNRNNNNNNFHNNNNRPFPPLSRPPPMPYPLMSMGFGNLGHVPAGPCGPQPLMSACNMGNAGPGPGSGPNSRNHRPLQPPPFWEDMMSPQHRPPPIQPPMPKCPSLWNLVPKDKSQQQRQNRKPLNQPNKKYKSNNSNTNSSPDAALMPPPPAPGDNSNGNSKNASPVNGAVKKKNTGGAFVQVDGKWIQRPEAPLPLDEAPPGTKEERQRQWREYRQAMKPFKNREFHNWKRTVQRLGKIPRDTLDEKQLDRLQKAEEFIVAHKAMLTVKHAEKWVQKNSPTGDATTNGQVYVRKPLNATSNKKDEHNSFQRVPPVGRKQTFGTGRAIKGGIVGEVGSAPPLPTGVPALIGEFPDMSLPSSYFGQTHGFNSSSYGQQSTNASSGTNSLYANLNSSFVKGGTLLPP